MSNIPSTPADGNFKVVSVNAIADIAVPKVSEITGGTAKDISCYITAGGWNFTIDQQAISDERLCDTFTAELPGRESVTLEATFIDNANSANATTFNEAATAFTKGSTIYLVTRRGKAFSGAFTASDKVTIVKAVVGVSNPLPPEANSVQRSSVKLFVQDYKQDVPVVAGA